MKTTIIMLFAATTALFAAETNSPVPTLLTNALPALQVDLFEQARLVTEIGQEAAKGFDAETHARSLRVQIEALLDRPSPTKPAAPASEGKSTALSTELAGTVFTGAAPAVTTKKAANPDPVALKAAIQILRTEADRLEAQLEKQINKP